MQRIDIYAKAINISPLVNKYFSLSLLNKKSTSKISILNKYYKEALGYEQIREGSSSKV